MAAISKVCRNAHTRAELLSVFLEQLSQLTNAKGTALTTMDAAGETTVEAATGDFIPFLNYHLAKGEGLTGYVIQTRTPYVSNDLHRETRLARPDLLKNLKSIGCVPLIADENVLGALWVGKEETMTDHDLHVFTAVADIAANAIHRISLYETTVNDTIKIKQAYDATLEGWAHALNLRDKETEGHSVRVIEYVTCIPNLLYLRYNKE